jgi:predicted amidohydrolase YtcJ
MAVTTARLVFRGGSIYTGDSATPRAEAVAVGDTEILYVGSAAGVEPFIGKKTRVIELGEQALFPGFIDAHTSLLDYARTRHDVDLGGVKSYEEMVRRVAQATRRSSRPNSWIIGRGWDENEWTVKDPIRLLNLQASTGSRSVVLYHRTDDAMIANAVVIASAGAEDVPDPPGGRFLRTRGGVLTGVIVDHAMDFIERVIPGPDPAELVTFYREAAESCAAHGITAVHDMNLSAAGIRALRQIADSKEGLPVRIYGVAGSLESLPTDTAKAPKEGDRKARLQLGAVGLKVDGGLATRGAALSRPYEDEPVYSGHVLLSPESLTVELGRIVAAGYQPVLRATGDEAVRISLDAIENVLGPVAERPAGPPPRIESAAIISPDEILRFKTLGVVASVQPFRVSTDYAWIEDRLGIDRPVRVYGWKSLQDAGVPLVFGSGLPGGPIDPVRGFYAAVTRQNELGRPAGGWTPAERLTREEALLAMTRNAAAAGRTGSVGMIVVGAPADLTLLSNDIMTVPEREILSATARLTVVGGEIVHDKMSHP